MLAWKERGITISDGWEGIATVDKTVLGGNHVWCSQSRGEENPTEFTLVVLGLCKRKGSLTILFMSDLYCFFNSFFLTPCSLYLIQLLLFATTTTLLLPGPLQLSSRSVPNQLPRKSYREVAETQP